jgi:hypothetical protein
MERTVLKCSFVLILNNFYKKSRSQNRPLKSLIHADDDDVERVKNINKRNTIFVEDIIVNSFSSGNNI